MECNKRGKQTSTSKITKLSSHSREQIERKRQGVHNQKHKRQSSDIENKNITPSQPRCPMNKNKSCSKSRVSILFLSSSSSNSSSPPRYSFSDEPLRILLPFEDYDDDGYLHPEAALRDIRIINITKSRR